ncbi:hypothetical protein N7492_005251 [Penicillium capsulatum]|uniref:Pentatricopeptide repeat protein n=1 Tax=Penicillium capsulatum TaxID=69766 RepID=A0A9W9LRY2_9EURO|nr:hypothetical protein N7492_005251 [Penicillium capsulatum]KAJ6135644.1 hypothetical protein N7512_000804 [Penicillium capsulatum]
MTAPRSIWGKALHTQLVQHQLAQAGSRRLTSCYVPNNQRSYSGQADRRRARERMPEDLTRSRLMAIASGDPIAMTASMNPRILAKEIEWLKDPRVLADRVGRLLRAKHEASAAAMVRQAHRQGISTVVSWNTLMKYCMEQGNWRAAFKFFNDMKKRGGKPNQATFTILLDGFRHFLTPDRKNSECFAMAESVYRSIFAPNNPVQPNIVHTNAMLSVCEAHGDMVKLWRIAGELPENGDRSPDMITYSIILGALQFTARADLKKIDAKDTDKISKRKVQMVQDAKRVWADVLHRWTKDQMPLDTTAVSAMAQVLLDDVTESSYYDVLALYHQTMGIPILATRPPENATPPPRSQYRIRGQARDSAIDQEYDVPFENEIEKEPTGRKQSDIEDGLSATEDAEENFDSLFDPIPSGDTEILPLKPGNKELTMIVEACSQMTQATAAGIAYWNHLTSEESPYRIKPDEQSIMAYLRLLRHSHSSKRAVQVIRDQVLPLNNASGKIFHVAMSICRRDKKNMSVLMHANDMLALMGESLILPHPRALESYLALVQSLSEEPQLLLQMKGLDTTKDAKKESLQSTGKRLQANLRLTALAALRPHIQNLDEVMEQCSSLDKDEWDAMEQKKPLSSARWDAALMRGGDLIRGDTAVKILNWARLMIDDTLQAHFSQFLTKEDREVLQAESKQLRPYSSDKAIQKYKHNRISLRPTAAQRNNFLQRRANFETSFNSKELGDKEEQTEEEKQEAREAQPVST